MPLSVVLRTKLPNACTETSFFPGFSDCENAGSAADAMPTTHVTTNLFANMSCLLFSYQTLVFTFSSVRFIQGHRRVQSFDSMKSSGCGAPVPRMGSETRLIVRHLTKLRQTSRPKCGHQW